MRKGTNRLTEIVDVMLDVSRLDAGGLVLNRTPVTISRIVERAAGEWKSALAERGHTFTTEGLETLPDARRRYRTAAAGLQPVAK